MSYTSHIYARPPERHSHSGSDGTSTLSIWLSVDPMSDKYPSMSPYTYCANNPVKLVDEDGREIGDFIANGTIIGNDGNKDGKLYVINNYSLTTKDYRRTKKFIKHLVFFEANTNHRPRNPHHPQK